MNAALDTPLANVTGKSLGFFAVQTEPFNFSYEQID